MLLSRVPAPDLIVAAMIAGMAVFVLLSEFLPCRRDRDQDDEEPGPLPA